jgi:hypothetical protein
MTLKKHYSTTVETLLSYYRGNVAATVAPRVLHGSSMASDFDNSILMCWGKGSLYYCFGVTRVPPHEKPHALAGFAYEEKSTSRKKVYVWS